MSEFYVYEEDDPVFDIAIKEEVKEDKTEINLNKEEKHNSKHIDNFTNLEKECLRLQQIQIQKLNASIVDQVKKMEKDILH
jgi:hypothetical protein